MIGKQTTKVIGALVLLIIALFVSLFFIKNSLTYSVVNATAIFLMWLAQIYLLAAILNSVNEIGRGEKK